MMDLKQYKNSIVNHLLGGLDDKAQKEKAIADGSYVPRRKCATAKSHVKIPREEYNELLRRMSIYQGPTISMKDNHVRTDHATGGSISYEEDGGNIFQSDDPIEVAGNNFGGKMVKRCTKRVKAKEDNAIAEEPIDGGKFNFVKSMKHMGKDIGHTAKDIGKAVKKSGIQAVAKEVANEGVKFAKNNIGKLVQGAEEYGPEALEVGEESAPLLLAGGLPKKVKRTRTISQKEANRHALIRKLMQKHGCTLAQASKLIKEKNMSY
jgi:DNA-directed RNA polymerase subunit H (RpoH/RPB5)